MMNIRVLTAVLLLAASPALAVPSTSVSVSGQVGTPQSFDAAALAALPQTTSTQTYTSGGTPVTDSFTGPTLSAVLTAAGGVATNPAIRNDLLRHYVIATGTDGYKAVVSAGEIAPNFGRRQDLVATRDSLGRLPGADGVARLVAAGDRAGGRYISNLTSLEVRSGPAIAGTGGGTTTSFVVQGAVGTVMSFDLPALQALTPYTQTVTYTSGSGTVTDTYTGALLWDVLGKAGITTNASVKNDILRKVVAAVGSDGYQVDFAVGELSPAFGNNPILVAYSDTLGQLNGSSGFARLVVGSDTAGGRYVSNLSSLTVFDATTVPEPGSLVLLGAGLGGLLLMRRRA